MGQLYIEYLEASKIYVCTQCKTHLALCQERISRVCLKTSVVVPWSTREGVPVQQRVLIPTQDNRINTYLGAIEEKMLMTGMHKVCDLFCACCDTLIGWKYVPHAAHTLGRST